MEVEAVIYLVRHGQTDHNRERKLQGHLDTHLDSYGAQQAAQCGRYLRRLTGGEPFDGLFGSDLARCRETGELILAEANRSEVWTKRPRRIFTELSFGLRERDMGELDGLEVEEARRLCILMGANMTSFGESRAGARERMVRQFLRILASIRKRHLRRVLIVTHSSVITRLMSYLQSSRKMIVPSKLEGRLGPVHNTAVAQMWLLKQGPLVLQSYGDTSHLTEESLDFAQGYNMDALIPETT